MIEAIKADIPIYPIPIPPKPPSMKPQTIRIILSKLVTIGISILFSLNNVLNKNIAMPIISVTTMNSSIPLIA